MELLLVVFVIAMIGQFLMADIKKEEDDDQ